MARELPRVAGSGPSASQTREVLSDCSVYADGAGESTREIQKHDLQNFETIVPGVLILE